MVKLDFMVDMSAGQRWPYSDQTLASPVDLWTMNLAHPLATPPPQMEQKKAEKNVLVGVTGSVAAIKVPELVEKLNQYKDLKVTSF